MVSNSSSSEQLRAQAHLFNASLGFISSMSLKCAVDLGIPDAIHRHSRPISLSDLTASLSLPSSKAPSLARLMRLLTHNGFFDLLADGYVLTPASRRLRECGAPHVRLLLDEAMLAPWIHMSAWFRGDVPASFDTAHGMSIWDYAEQNPGFNGLFNEAMTHDSDLITDGIVARCGEIFDGVASVVDVGGGNGSMALAIAEAFPHVKCTVFDLPHVVAGMPENGKVEYIGGSMFESIPPAEALLLRRILHDYNDEDCQKILRRCKEAIPSKQEGGKVIIVDMVLNVVKNDLSESIETQLLYDLQMMAIPGGKERNDQEWQNIFIQADFTSYKITLVTELICLIEEADRDLDICEPNENGTVTWSTSSDTTECMYLCMRCQRTSERP